MLKFEIKGLKEIQHRLNDLQRRAKSIDGQHDVPLDELFTTDFLSKYTDFVSLDNMFQASGFVVKSKEDFEKIPNDQWDNFIKSHAQFSGWKEMLKTAVNKWTASKLGF